MNNTKPNPYQHLEDEQRQIELAPHPCFPHEIITTFFDDEIYCDVCGTHYTTEDPCPFH